LKRLTLVAIWSLITILFRCGPALADSIPYPKQPCDAKYSYVGEGAGGTLHVVCDGVGHIRVEDYDNLRHDTSLPSRTTIHDYLNKCTKCTRQAVGQHIEKLPFVEFQIWDDESARFLAAHYPNTKPIGSRRIVAGHRCHGYEVRPSTGGVFQYWIGEDTKFLVANIYLFPTTSAGNYAVCSRTELTSWSNKQAKSESVTELPTDLTESEPLNVVHPPEGYYFCLPQRVK
jgi:hypothetical protein